MAVLLNSAGGSAGDPILNGLGFEWVIEPTSMDVAVVGGAWVDTNSTIPGTNSATLSPLGSVINSSATATYTTATGKLTLSNVTGLSVGDYVWVSHANQTPTAQAVKILTITSNDITFTPNNFSASNATNVSYQVAWRSLLTAGTSPTTSSGGGTQNFYKARLDDAVGNHGDLSESNYIRNAPAGSSYVALNSGSYTGTTTNLVSIPWSVLSGWTNHGGIATVQIGQYGGSGANDFTFSDTTIAEKSLSSATGGNLLITSGDGLKQCRLIFRAKTASSVVVNLDIDITLDATAPTVAFQVFGR